MRRIIHCRQIVAIRRIATIFFYPRRWFCYTGSKSSAKIPPTGSMYSRTAATTPIICPNCNSPYWNSPRIREKSGLKFTKLKRAVISWIQNKNYVYATPVSSCIKNVRNFSYTRAVFSTNGAWPASAIVA